MGLQGVVSPAQLQAHSTTPLVYVAQVIGGNTTAKLAALAIALSVIGGIGTTIILGARMIYGMASYRTLPPFLGNVSSRFSTPVAASLLVGALMIGLTWIYLLLGSVQAAFSAVIDVSGLLFASFYVLTALASIVYYRRRVLSNAWDAILVGILPFAAAGFLVWVIYKSLQQAPASQQWALVGIAALGLVMMFVARFVLRSPFFQIPLESASKYAGTGNPGHPGVVVRGLGA